MKFGTKLMGIRISMGAVSYIHDIPHLKALSIIPIMFREAFVMSVHPADWHPLRSHIDLLQSPFKDANGFINVIVDNCQVKKMTIGLF